MALLKVSESKHSLNIHFLAAESANAFSLTAATELAKIQKKYKSWKKPVLVMSDHGKVFCSGGHLGDYKKLKGKPPGLKINRSIEKILNDFGNWSVPKIAVIEAMCSAAEWNGSHVLISVLLCLPHFGVLAKTHRTFQRLGRRSGLGRNHR